MEWGGAVRVNPSILDKKEERYMGREKRGLINTHLPGNSFRKTHGPTRPAIAWLGVKAAARPTKAREDPGSNKKRPGQEGKKKERSTIPNKPNQRVQTKGARENHQKMMNGGQRPDLTKFFTETRVPVGGKEEGGGQGIGRDPQGKGEIDHEI